MTAQTDPQLAAAKAQLKAVWSAGDFGVVALHITEAAEDFMRRRDIRPGVRVLDVACGTGNLAIPAAKAGAIVSGLDFAPNLIAQARERAAREKLDIKFEEGDAEDMPYRDGAFDVVVSMFGAMFAPRHEVAAKELLRVTRSGGRIGMANWTPSGFVGDFFRTVARYTPPPPGPTAILWGEEANVRRYFGDGISALTATPRIAQMRYPFPPAEAVEFYRKFFGPVLTAFGRLDGPAQEALTRDLVTLFTEHNRATDGTTHVAGEYLDVDAVKR